MRIRRFILLLFVPVIIAACTSTSGSPAASPTTAPTAAAPQNNPTLPAQPEPNPTESVETAPPAPDGGWTLTPAQDPIDLEIALEEGAQVETLVPTSGGTLTVTGENGAVYTLEIPADALLQDTRISMTPVDSVRGMPFSGGDSRTYAVQLEPEGLAFQQLVTLTIQAPEAIPVTEQIFFGYEQTGEGLFLAPPVVDSTEVQLQLLHFSGYGVTKGLLADIEPVRARLGGKEETRLTSAVAEQLTAERQRQLEGSEDASPELALSVQALFDEYLEKVVAPRVAAAGESCAAGRLAVETVLGFERQRQLLGGSDDAPSEYMENIEQLIETAGLVCLEEEYSLCAEDHIIHRIIPVWLGFERESQLFGGGEFGESVLGKQARKYVDQCLRFELEFESTSSFGDSSFGYQSSVSASVPLQIEAGGLDITGQGVLVNESFDAWADYCTVSKGTGDGFINVSFLTYETGQKDGNDVLGYVKDMHMGYLSGGTGEHATFSCENGDIVSGVFPGAWSVPFLMLHEHEMVTDETQLRFDATGWKILGGELFAERSWQYEGDGASESGSFKLYHRPGE